MIMSNYEHNARKFGLAFAGMVAIILITALFIRCDKDCYICDVEKPELVYLSGGIYIRWVYDQQEQFCGGLPESDDYIPRFSSDNFWDRYYEAERYTNCIPN
jgi:hypothetical protein